MGITVSEAARRWGVGRETIYRKQRAGELSFATTEPPTVEPSEMLRVFGDPKRKREGGQAAAPAEDAIALARTEAERDALKAEVERLKVEVASVKDELRGERDEIKKEREKLLDMLASQQRLIENQARKPSLLERIGLVKPKELKGL